MKMENARIVTCTIEETLSKTIDVVAPFGMDDNEAKVWAENHILEKYKNCEIVLTADDYDSTTIIAKIKD